MIYILGAIVLLGILVIMVKGSTTPGAGIDSEALQLKVAEVQEYGMELERAVTYILRDGYSESDIRFAHPNHSSAYGDITDDPGRQVFARAGGGATWRDNDVSIQSLDRNWVYNAANVVLGVGSSDTTSGNTVSSDLIALLPYVSLDFCLTINDKNNITNPTGSPPQDLGTMDLISQFSGNYTRVNVIGLIPASITDLYGKKEGCLEGDSNPPSGTYHYYRVLLAR